MDPLTVHAHAQAMGPDYRPLALGIEIDAVVVRVPSHVLPVRKGCHRQRRRHLQARSRVFDTKYLLHRLLALLLNKLRVSISIAIAASTFNASTLQRTLMRKHGASRSPRLALDVHMKEFTRMILMIFMQPS